MPVNFRVVDKAEGKTKNELFREMVSEVLGWGLRPALVSAEPLVLGPGKEPHRQRTRA